MTGAVLPLIPTVPPQASLRPPAVAAGDTSTAASSARTAIKITA